MKSLSNVSKEDRILTGQAKQDMDKLIDIEARYLGQRNFSVQQDIDLAWVISTLRYYLNKELRNVT